MKPKLQHMIKPTSISISNPSPCLRTASRDKRDPHRQNCHRQLQMENSIQQSHASAINSITSHVNKKLNHFPRSKTKTVIFKQPQHTISARSGSQSTNQSKSRSQQITREEKPHSIIQSVIAAKDKNTDTIKSRGSPQQSRAR
ncbi:hypothetical protein Droror1_Dr00023601 [Drosera rotundifolia]